MCTSCFSKIEKTKTKSAMNNQFEILKMVFAIALTIKYWKLNLTKDVQNIYIENYKMLLRDIKEHKQMEKYECETLLKCHVFPNWSIDSSWSQSKSQRLFPFCKLTNWFWNSNGDVKDSEWPNNRVGEH